MDVEDELGRGPRLEVDPREADQLPHGPGDPRHRVVQVDLDDLVTGPVAGVRHHDAQLDRLVGADLLGAGAHVAQLEGGVRRAVPERVERAGVDRGDAGTLDAAQRRLEVGARLTARTTRDLHRQLASGAQPSGEHAGDRRPALLAGEERLHQTRKASVRDCPARRDGPRRRPAPRASRSPAAPRPGRPGLPAAGGPRRRIPRRTNRGRTARRGRRRRPRRGRRRARRPPLPGSRCGPRPSRRSRPRGPPRPRPARPAGRPAPSGPRCPGPHAGGAAARGWGTRSSP